MSRYTIEAALFRLPLPFTKFAHNFWVLRELDNHQVIAQLHGLATSRRSGRILPIGLTKNHTLRAHHFIYDVSKFPVDTPNSGQFCLPLHENRVLVVGDQAIELWLQGVRMLAKINQLDLRYPSCGFNVPFATTINSNSIYRTFADIMNLCAYQFDDYYQIGIENSIISLIKNLG